MSYKEMFQYIIDEVSGNFVVSTPHWYERYAKQLMIGSGAVVVCGLAGWYVIHERTNAQQKATSALSETLQEYQDAQRSSKETAWSDVETAVKSGISLSGSTGVAPYFNALQADIDLRAGDVESARLAMHTAANGLRLSDPVKDLYLLTAARMDLEHESKQIQEKALSVLQSYANNTQSFYQDMAQYYLGLWYVQHDRAQDAHAVLSALLTSQEKFEGKDEYSPWADAARELIDQVAV